MSIWDHKLKKRLRQYSKYSGPVSSIAFNNDGSKLAVAVSYTWDEGEEGARTAERPRLFIRATGEEVKVGFPTVVYQSMPLTHHASTAKGMGRELNFGVG